MASKGMRNVLVMSPIVVLALVAIVLVGTPEVVSVFREARKKANIALLRFLLPASGTPFALIGAQNV